MSKKRIVQVILVIALIIVNIFVFKFCNVELTPEVKVQLNIESNINDTYMLFYGSDKKWMEQTPEIVEYKAGSNDVIEFNLPTHQNQFRIDFGEKTPKLLIKSIKVVNGKNELTLSEEQITDITKGNQIDSITKVAEGYELIATGNDPFMGYEVNINDLQTLNTDSNLSLIIKILLCVVIDTIGIVLIINIKKILALIYEVAENRKLIWNLSKSDFRTKYAGSYLGITWAFVQPIVTILVYWFVFEFGLKSGSPIEGVPFVVWFVSGLIPWFFFQEALQNATNCMAEYSYLVKKVVFKISILPIVKGISALFVHLVFVGFLFVVAGIYGFGFSIYSIQIIYYSFCTFCLALALAYGTCAMIVFFKDLGQIINIALQVGMWMTPIMWSYTIIPERLRWLVKINPMYYIVEGYRDTFINHVWFWNRYFQTVSFWCIVLVLFAIGQIIFRRLKPHFADVL